MQIVIDIPEVFYEALRKTDEIISGQRSGKTLTSVIFNAVANGTPLPKGHGRLIDASMLKQKYSGLLESARLIGVDVSPVFIDNAPTIIEADKEDE